MAEKRMFTKQIIDSDAFLDMPLSAQALYFHLGMRADDDGFVNAPKKIQRIVGAGDDDARLLIAKNFIIPFESGVIVIKHWRLHNTIQRDRYKPTNYQEELALLDVKPNKAYTLRDHEEAVESECIQDVYRPITQIREDKNRIDQNSEEEEQTVELPWFKLADASIYSPTTATFREWVKAFPTLNVIQCLNAAAAKNNAQEIKKRKNIITVEPYIVNWLILEQAEHERQQKWKKRNGFADMEEHDHDDTKLMKELEGRNGNLV